MAKFKVGDKVTDGNGTYLITEIDRMNDEYVWKPIGGKAEPSHSAGGKINWADSMMKIANSVRSTNSVVANAVAAKNAAGDVVQKFGGDVECKVNPADNFWSMMIYYNGIQSPFSNRSKDDCIAQAKKVLAAVKAKADGIGKAIAWMQKNG